MQPSEGSYLQLAQIPDLQLTRNEPLARHTRFEIGGPASLFAEARTEAAFIEALELLRRCELRHAVIGAGTNLIAADSGYPGVVLSFVGHDIAADGTRVSASAGASLQSLVDFTVERGLQGLENMTGIPGQVGAALYGNAGAYGSSMSDFVREVRYFDGETIRTLDRSGCQFRYRSSAFKQSKDWVILSVALDFQTGDAAALTARAQEILTLRNRKYPPDMRCAGSIFKNLILAELPARVQSMIPPEVVKGGKVPSAWFLDLTGVKGMRSGAIRVADYHANLIYNDGAGTARQVRQVAGELKNRVRERFGIELEEEIQYIGFDTVLPGLDTLASTVKVIDGLIGGMSGEDLAWTPAPGRWSIGEVLLHLTHCEQHCFIRRAQDMLAECDPIIEPYDVEAFNALDWGFDGDGRAALAHLRDLRLGILELLETQPASSGERAGIHPELGRITLDQLLNEWAFHDLGHIRQIAEIVRSQRYYPRMGPFRPLYKLNP
jgi:UDP-N-acetylmuramate dehydrogenase